MFDGIVRVFGSQIPFSGPNNGPKCGFSDIITQKHFKTNEPARLRKCGIYYMVQKSKFKKNSKKITR